MLNPNNRIFENKDYLDFIRRLPCSITGMTGVQAHHAATKGMGGGTNDYYAVPLHNLQHIGPGGHITEQKLEAGVNERITERIIFYLSLYIEFLDSKYDLDADEECNFYQLRRKMKMF